MLLSLNWLRDFVEIPENISAKKLAELITMHTAEVEGLIDQAAAFEKMVIGRVEEIRKHPNADKLQICMVDIGTHKNQIVCGGNNLREGMLVPVALPGALVKWHGQGDLIKLEKAVLRGEESNGMICAGEEIGLTAAPEGGITDLSHLEVKPGTPLAQALGMNDIILEIDNKSLTHRPDLWGHYGMAREIATIFQKKLQPYKIKTDYSSGKEKLTVEIQDKEVCRRFLGVIIKNIKIEESPKWLKERLEAVGINPVNAVVDATNYYMVETGHPMHAYDRKFVGNDKLVIRYAHKGEKIETLDHKTRELTSQDGVVTDGQRPLGLAGIMGGAHSEITDFTKEIILESGNWNPVMIRKTSQRLGLRSDAAQRYEKNIDPITFHHGFYKCLELILKLCPGAEVASPVEDHRSFQFQQPEILLNSEKACSKIGKKISEKEIVRILESLEFEIKKVQGKNSREKIPSKTSRKSSTKTAEEPHEDGKILQIKVPSFRAHSDVTTEDDLIEEIARIYGYDNIQPELPPLPIKLPERNIQRALKHEARDILSYGLGFDEIYTYSFYSRADLSKCMLEEKTHIRIENYLSEDQTHMRLSLLPGMLKAIAANLKHADSFKLYTFGRTYEETGNYWPKEEKKILAAIIAPKNSPEEIFYQIKGALESFLNRFGFAGGYQFEKENNISDKKPDTSSEKIMLIIDGKKCGNIYELDPRIAHNYEISAKVGIFELNFARVTNEENSISDRKATTSSIKHDKNTSLTAANSLEEGYLCDLERKITRYQPLPKFPGNSFDVSVTFDEFTLYQKILDCIEQSAHDLIADIELFDLYRGDKIPKGKKNLAFRILLQAPDRTITDAEMSQVQKLVFSNLQKAGGEIRGL